METTVIEEFNLIPKINCQIKPHGLGSRFGLYKEGTIDILQSIELHIREIFSEINESETPTLAGQIDIIKINEFFMDWVLKSGFKAFAFGPELEKNFKKIEKLIKKTREIYELNKPEIEKLKLVQRNFENVMHLKIDVIAELKEVEKNYKFDSDLPIFDQLFQKSAKYLAKIAKLVSRLNRFKLLFAISPENVNDWVEKKHHSMKKFKNITDATAQLVKHFVDLENDLKTVENCTYQENDDTTVILKDQ